VEAWWPQTVIEALRAGGPCCPTDTSTKARATSPAQRRAYAAGLYRLGDASIDSPVALVAASLSSS
jgi:hypothetical protein